MNVTILEAFKIFIFLNINCSSPIFGLFSMFHTISDDVLRVYCEHIPYFNIIINRRHNKEVLETSNFLLEPPEKVMISQRNYILALNSFLILPYSTKISSPSWTFSIANKKYFTDNTFSFNFQEVRN